MSDKLQWEVDRIKESNKDKDKDIKDHAKRLSELEAFKISTIEKLLIIFTKIEEIKEGDKWIKRTFTGTLITAIIGAVVSFVVWAIQN